MLSCTIDAMESWYVATAGNILKITITWGKIHKYLGMTINYSSSGKVIISIVDYIGSMINDTPLISSGVSLITLPM